MTTDKFKMGAGDALSQGKLSQEQYDDLMRLNSAIEAAGFDWTQILKLLPLIGTFIPGLGPLVPFITALIPIIQQIIDEINKVRPTPTPGPTPTPTPPIDPDPNPIPTPH